MPALTRPVVSIDRLLGPRLRDHLDGTALRRWKPRRLALALLGLFVLADELVVEDDLGPGPDRTSEGDAAPGRAVADGPLRDDAPTVILDTSVGRLDPGRDRSDPHREPPSSISVVGAAWAARGGQRRDEQRLRPSAVGAVRLRLDHRVDDDGIHHAHRTQYGRPITSPSRPPAYFRSSFIDRLGAPAGAGLGY